MLRWLLVYNAKWMLWNAALALVPLILALVLFGRRARRSPLWWVGVVAFVAFLPNAPYVLTDVVHFRTDLAMLRGTRATTAICAQYAALFALGFGTYAVCLGLVRRAMRQARWSRWVWPVEFGLHGLCAVGLFIGRTLRFNSWDLLTRPAALAPYFRVPKPWTLMVIGATFVLLLVGVVALRGLAMATRRTPLTH